MTNFQTILTDVKNNAFRVIDVVNTTTKKTIAKSLSNEIAIQNYGGLEQFFKRLKENGLTELTIIHKSRNGQNSRGQTSWRKRETINISLSPNNNNLTPANQMTNQTQLHLAEPTPQSDNNGLNGIMQTAKVLGLNGVSLIKSFSAQDSLERLKDDYLKLKDENFRLKTDLNAKETELKDLDRKLLIQEVETERSKKGMGETVVPLVKEFMPVFAQIMQARQPAQSLNAPAPDFTNLTENAKSLANQLMQNVINDDLAYAMLVLKKAYAVAEFQGEFVELLTKHNVLSNDNTTN